MAQNGAGHESQRPVNWPSQTFLGMLSEDARDQLLSLGVSREYLSDSALMLEGDRMKPMLWP